MMIEQHMACQRSLTAWNPRPSSTAEAGVGLRHVPTSPAEPLVELQAAPAGLDVEASEIGILDPEDPARARPDGQVLAVGVRGRAVLPVLRAAGPAGAAAVAVTLDAPGQTAMLGEAVAEAGTALLSVHRGNGKC
ncbi:hypothetical protein [Streptomyces albospinus]|uniref:hypothetical protein n=1 Tax=Streptomyces albospinus TaxID=285515 RepID=UPI001E2A6688|nr:hypothetical protein [Streptomyces albospinus]